MGCTAARAFERRTSVFIIVIVVVVTIVSHISAGLRIAWKWQIPVFSFHSFAVLPL
jgi:hypothetical protein